MNAANPVPTTDNYLKISDDFFFFDSKDENSRALAWRLASARQRNPEQISVWKSRDKGRYPGEKGDGGVHPVVTERLAPIAAAVRVIGYSFHKDRMAESDL